MGHILRNQGRGVVFLSPYHGFLRQDREKKVIDPTGAVK
jgi:hypothetical protein